MYDAVDTFFGLFKRHGRMKSIELAIVADAQHSMILQALLSVSIPLQTLKLNAYTRRGIAGLIGYQDLLNKKPSGLAAMLKQLKEFSWTFHWYGTAMGDSDEDQGDQIDMNNIVHGFLAMIQEVETLFLGWSAVVPIEKDLSQPEASFFDFTYKAVLALPKLQDFRLYGGIVSEETLLNFLTTTSAARISLCALRLRAGTWRSILDVLTDGRFKYIQAEGLHELEDGDDSKRWPIYFHATGVATVIYPLRLVEPLRLISPPIPLQYSTMYNPASSVAVAIRFHEGKPITARV